MAAEDELQSSINKLNETIQKIQKVADNANSLAASLNTENNTIKQSIEEQLRVITVYKKIAVQAQKSITQSITNQTALINTAKLEQAASEQLAAQKFKQGQSIAAELNDNATQIEKQRAAMENSTVDQLRFQQRSMEGLENTQSKLQAAMKNNTEEYDNSISAIAVQNDRINKASKEIQGFNEKQKLLGEVTRGLTAEEQQLTINLKQQNDPFKKLKAKLEGPVMSEFVKLADGLKNLTDSIYKTQQRFGVSFDTAASLYKDTLINSATSFFGAVANKGPFVSQEEILSAGQSFTKQFGTVLQPEEMNRIAKEAKALGVSSDVYVNAKRAFLGTGNEEATRMRAMSEFAKNGLSAGQAIQFAADNADLLAVAGEKYSDSLFRAAAESKKIGVNLRDIEKFANSVVGDFEGSLENFAELSALGVEMDFNKLAQVSATGTTDEIKDVLSQQLSMSGITGEELQRNRQVRLALTQTTGLDEASILRLAGVVEEPKEPTLDDKQLAAATEANSHLGRIAEFLGATGGIFSTVVGIVGKIAAFGGAIYQFTLSQQLKGVTNQLANLTSSGAAVGGKLPGGGLPGITSPVIPPTTGGGGALGSAAQGASRFSVSSVLQGAAAMLVVAASVYVLAKGLQQFSTVNLADMGKAAAALIVLAGGAFALSFIAPQVFTGSLAIAALGASIIPFAAAIRFMAPGLPALSQFITTLSQLKLEQVGILALLGPALSSMAVGLIAVGGAALVAAPGLAILGGLQKLGMLPAFNAPAAGTPVGSTTTGDTTSTTTKSLLPAFNAPAAGTPVGSTITGDTTAITTKTTNSIDTRKLEAKLDQLISTMKTMKVEMNGYEVGHVSFNEARTPLRVR